MTTGCKRRGRLCLCEAGDHLSTSSQFPNGDTSINFTFQKQKFEAALRSIIELNCPCNRRSRLLFTPARISIPLTTCRKGSSCFALRNDRVVEVVGEPATIHKAIELIVSQLRKFLVDHTIIPLFEMQVVQHMQIPYVDVVIEASGSNICYVHHASGTTVTFEISGSSSQVQASQQLI